MIQLPTLPWKRETRTERHMVRKRAAFLSISWHVASLYKYQISPNTLHFTWSNLISFLMVSFLAQHIPQSSQSTSKSNGTSSALKLSRVLDFIYHLSHCPPLLLWAALIWILRKIKDSTKLPRNFWQRGRGIEISLDVWTRKQGPGSTSFHRQDLASALDWPPTMLLCPCRQKRQVEVEWKISWQMIPPTASRGEKNILLGSPLFLLRVPILRQIVEIVLYRKR